MSIAIEITRLNNAKAAIKSAIEAKGVEVPQDAKIDIYAGYIAQIPQGGGTEYEPICFTSLEDGNTFSLNKEISISVDDKQTWQTLAANTPSPVINTGEKIYFKATDNAQPFYGTTLDYYHFTTEKTCNVSGDPYALYAEISGYYFYKLFSDSKIVDAGGINLDGYILSNGCYISMFQGCTSLTTAPKLPATTLATTCYQYMFQGCTSLTTAPELPATTLQAGCYQYMFSGCTSLTTAPELPATNLADNCYQYMFQNCTSLTTAPELPAITLKSYCYSNMFNGCTSLNYIKALFTTAPSSSYTRSWVSGVSSTGKFVKNKAATWTLTGNNGIPTGWTVQVISV